MNGQSTPIVVNPQQRLLVFAKQRLAAFCDEVVKLERGEFPYPAAQEALVQIKSVFEEHSSIITLLDEGSDPNTLSQVCQRQLSDLWNCLPLLGFILRSTNVRNAFEIYMPLQRLAWQILGPDAKMLMSSEWDYSPFNYSQIPILPAFVFIGMPAHESGNPLLAPMAGHELGHSLWARVVENSLWHPSFANRVKDSILDGIRQQWKTFQKLFPDVQKPEDLETELFATAHWAPAYAWSLRQCEEYFCDFVGIRLFGESFFYAFGHLLAPMLEGRRALHYPNMIRRVSAQLKAGGSYGITAPEDYKSWFLDGKEVSDDDVQNKFLVDLADKAADQLIPELIDHADSLLSQPGLPEWKDKKAQKNREDAAVRILDDFRLVAPAERATYLSDILNAGWRAAMAKIPQVPEHSSDAVLRELILKSLEVFEFEAKMKGFSNAQV